MMIIMDKPRCVQLSQETMNCLTSLLRPFFLRQYSFVDLFFSLRKTVEPVFQVFFFRAAVCFIIRDGKAREPSEITKIVKIFPFITTLSNK